MEPAVGAKDAMINLKDVIEVERAEVLNADPRTSVKVSIPSPSPLSALPRLSAASHSPSPPPLLALHCCV